MNRYRFVFAAFLFYSLLVMGTTGCRSVSKDNPFLGGIGELAWTDESLEKDWTKARKATSRRKAAKKEKEEQNQQLLSSVERRFYPVDYYCGSASPYRLLFDGGMTSDLMTTREGISSSLCRAPVPETEMDPELESILSGIRKTAPATKTSPTPLQREQESEQVRTETTPGVRPITSIVPLPREGNPIRQVEYIDAVRSVPRVEMGTEGAGSEANKTEVNSTTTNTGWEEQTRRAILALQKELEIRQTAGTITASEQAKLRLLRLTVGEEEPATIQSGCENESLRRFWEEQCSGLSAVLHGNLLDMPGNTQSVTKAAEHFQVGLDSLKENCPIAMPKCFVVETVAPFGLYEKKSSPIHLGEPVYVYAELENVTAKETLDGVEMAVFCRWELLDANGNVVVPACEQLCHSVTETRLRDIVLNITVETETSFTAGDYTLVLSVSDRNHPNPTIVKTSLPVRLTP